MSATCMRCHKDFEDNQLVIHDEAYEYSCYCKPCDELVKQEAKQEEYKAQDEYVVACLAQQNK